MSIVGFSLRDKKFFFLHISIVLNISVSVIVIACCRKKIILTAFVASTVSIVGSPAAAGWSDPIGMLLMFPAHVRD